MAMRDGKHGPSCQSVVRGIAMRFLGGSPAGVMRRDKNKPTSR
jgi:hypothetical protein